MLATALRPKKCRSCGERFTPTRPLQVACGVPCALEHARAVKAKKEAREHREAKAKAKPRSKWLAEAQRAFNRFIRVRDARLPCVSCGREHVEMTAGGAWDCGHYLSVGSHPELRFDETNAAKQCKKCNGGSGRFAHKNHTVSQAYRATLIERIGLAEVERLEGPHDPRRYSIDELKTIKAYYTREAREMEAQRGARQ